MNASLFTCLRQPIICVLPLQHAAGVGAGGHGGVLGQAACLDPRLGRLPGLLTLGQLLLGELDVDLVVRNVDLDDIAVLEQADGSADRRFRADVPMQAPRAAAEAAVGDWATDSPRPAPIM
jgi:hypothetical protein